MHRPVVETILEHALLTWVNNHATTHTEGVGRGLEALRRYNPHEHWRFSMFDPLQRRYRPVARRYSPVTVRHARFPPVSGC